MNNSFMQADPMVSIMMPTHNRRRYLPEALASALAQDYSNFEIVLIRDGGDDVSDIVRYFNDPRISFINRDVNKGKAYSLNEGLSQAKGKYICYLDDDDAYYPNHVSTLVGVLEDGERYQVAYSDLYKSHCRVESDGCRTVLSKNVEITRDFDRMFMLHFNIALHVSIMHRKDLLDLIGPYNEKLKILIDWDFTRRASFFADFKHVHTITGQFYGPVGDCDRISVQQRKDTADYIKNVLAIRTTRPQKPWNKLKDLSIILLADEIDDAFGKYVRDLWLYTFYPYKLHFPMDAGRVDKFNTQMPVFVKHRTEEVLSDTGKVDAVLPHCEGDYVAIVQAGYPLRDVWIEKALSVLIKSGNSGEVIELEKSGQGYYAAVMHKEALVKARQKYPNMEVMESILASGFQVRRPREDEYCFGFDSHLLTARREQDAGDWFSAAQIYDLMKQKFGNKLWMDTMCSYSLFRAERYEKAMEIISAVNDVRPTVSTLQLQGKILSKLNNPVSAIEYFEMARDVLENNSTANVKIKS